MTEPETQAQINKRIAHEVAEAVGDAVDKVIEGPAFDKALDKVVSEGMGVCCPCFGMLGHGVQEGAYNCKFMLGYIPRKYDSSDEILNLEDSEYKYGVVLDRVSRRYCMNEKVVRAFFRGPASAILCILAWIAFLVQSTGDQLVQAFVPTLLLAEDLVFPLVTACIVFPVIRMTGRAAAIVDQVGEILADVIVLVTLKLPASLICGYTILYRLSAVPSLNTMISFVEYLIFVASGLGVFAVPKSLIRVVLNIVVLATRSQDLSAQSVTLVTLLVVNDVLTFCSTTLITCHNVHVLLKYVAKYLGDEEAEEDDNKAGEKEGATEEDDDIFICCGRLNTYFPLFVRANFKCLTIFGFFGISLWQGVTGDFVSAMLVWYLYAETATVSACHDLRTIEVGRAMAMSDE